MKVSETRPGLSHIKQNLILYKMAKADQLSIIAKIGSIQLPQCCNYWRFIRQREGDGYRANVMICNL